MMNTLLPMPRKLTRAEAAEYLGVSLATLDRELRAGRISAYRAGRRKTYYLPRELDAYIERNLTPCRDENSDRDKSGNIGQVSGRIRPCITEPGSTRRQDKHDGKALALQILRKPAKD
jgi:excisionase family DNA binding protein